MDRNEHNRSVLKQMYERVLHPSRVTRGVGVVGAAASIALTGCGTSAHEKPSADLGQGTTQSASQKAIRSPEVVRSPDGKKSSNAAEQNQSGELSVATYTQLGLDAARKAINAITSQGDIITPMWGHDYDGNPGVYGTYILGDATNTFDVGLYQEDPEHPTPELDIAIGYKVNTQETFPNSPKEALIVELGLKPTSNLMDKYQGGVTTDDILSALSDGSVAQVKKIEVDDFTAVKSPTDRKDAKIYDLSQSSVDGPVKAHLTKTLTDNLDSLETVPMDVSQAAVGIKNAVNTLTK